MAVATWRGLADFEIRLFRYYGLVRRQATFHTHLGGDKGLGGDNDVAYLWFDGRCGNDKGGVLATLGMKNIAIEETACEPKYAGVVTKMQS